MNIRLVQESDLEELAQVYVATYEATEVDEQWTVPTAYKLLSYWLHRQPDLAYCAEVEGKLVGGFFVGVRPWWNGNFLDGGELFVHPAFQKRKVATELCKKVYRVALEKYEVVSFDTFTFKKTPFPLSWYKKQGFKENEDWVMISANVKEILEYLEEDD